MLKQERNERTRAYIFLSIGLIITLYPFVLMVMSSFMTPSQLLNNPSMIIPMPWTLSGYTGLFKDLNVLLLFKNTIIIAGSVTLLNLFFDSLAAFALAKLKFPGKNALFGFMLFTLMIPGVLFFIPTYTMLYNWGWVNHYRALIIPSFVQFYSIFLMKQFMEQIPDEVIEAARIDGASDPVIYSRIIVPMSIPVMATIAILTFMGAWNDFFGPLLYLRSPKMWTVQLGLQMFSSSIPGQNIQVLWAGEVVITLPILIVFLFLQKYFIRAFTNVSFK
jgi:multiple sugar transport system permease protein